MSLLDDAYRRHQLLRELAQNEGLRALAEPQSARNFELGLVELGLTLEDASAKIASFFEMLGRRIDELGFLDLFVSFEQELDRLRARVPKSTGRRPPSEKRLAEHLRNIDRELADNYEILKLERNRFAHTLQSPFSGPVEPIPEVKGILEQVLSIYFPAPSFSS